MLTCCIGHVQYAVFVYTLKKKKKKSRWRCFVFLLPRDWSGQIRSQLSLFYFLHTFWMYDYIYIYVDMCFFHSLSIVDLLHWAPPSVTRSSRAWGGGCSFTHSRSECPGWKRSQRFPSHARSRRRSRQVKNYLNTSKRIHFNASAGNNSREKQCHYLLQNHGQFLQSLGRFAYTAAEFSGFWSGPVTLQNLNPIENLWMELKPEGCRADLGQTSCCSVCEPGKELQETQRLLNQMWTSNFPRFQIIIFSASIEIKELTQWTSADNEHFWSSLFSMWGKFVLNWFLSSLWLWAVCDVLLMGLGLDWNSTKEPGLSEPAEPMKNLTLFLSRRRRWLLEHRRLFHACGRRGGDEEDAVCGCCGDVSRFSSVSFRVKDGPGPEGGVILALWEASVVRLCVLLVGH